jgi:hypothetical protein
MVAFSFFLHNAAQPQSGSACEVKFAAPLVARVTQKGKFKIWLSSFLNAF